jgi:hypothetical protein
MPPGRRSHSWSGAGALRSHGSLPASVGQRRETRDPPERRAPPAIRSSARPPLDSLT